MHKRLLLLVTDLLIGGTPSVVRELAIRLAREGVDVEVACLAEWGPTADQISGAGVKVTALGARGANDLRVIGRLRELAKSGGFDVVLSFLVHANVAATLALAGRDVHLFQSIQTTQPKPRWHWLAQAAIQGAAERIIVPTESVAKAANRRSLIPRERIIVIPNAVDTTELGGISRTPTIGGQVRVGFLGRLDPVKRMPDLLQAISMLPTEYRLLVFGTGRDESRIRDEIIRLGLNGRVEMRGPVDRPSQALAEMDVLVLPSEAEGFGLVLIEAMAAGVPVIGTDVPGIRDVIRGEEDGLLVLPANPAALAEGVRRISSSQELRQRLVAGGRDSAVHRFSWQNVIPRYRDVLGV